MVRYMLIEYSRNDALIYAKTWAYDRNPKFYDFSNIGGNCTNFVSQCLLAGNMPMNFSYPLGWFYKNINSRSPSFSSAKYLFNFLTNGFVRRGPIAAETHLSELKIGDIIQLSFDGNNYTHSLIVVEENELDPLVAANSDDTLGKPLSGYNFESCRALNILGAYK